jgi:hypothetical protein
MRQAASLARASGSHGHPTQVCSGTVIVVHAPGDAGPAVAHHPHDRPLDAGVQVAAAMVVGEEGVQLGQQAHGPVAYRSRPACASRQPALTPPAPPSPVAGALPHAA